MNTSSSTEPKVFVAVIGTDRIMTTLAHNEEGAIGVVEGQLRRDNQQGILDKWITTGRKFAQKVSVVNVCDIMDELGLRGLDFQSCSAVIMAWVRDNDGHYYAETRENFSEWMAIEEARGLGKSLVVVEDLS